MIGPIDLSDTRELTPLDARMTVRCPVCGAMPGDVCYPGEGWAGIDREKGCHGARFEAARVMKMAREAEGVAA